MSFAEEKRIAEVALGILAAFVIMGFVALATAT